MDEKDRNKLIHDYRSRYETYGYSPKTLGWDKGKQDVRFEVLTAPFQISGKKILDIGCGFADLCSFLERKNSPSRTSFTYCGVDLVEPLIAEAKNRHPAHTFVLGDFLDLTFGETFDFAVASGIFNRKYEGSQDNYTLIEKSIAKALALVQDGIAFDFLSDQVDYQYAHTFHSSPSRILEIAYQYSRNVLLRNDYMPFEFSLYIFKDDSFDKQDTLFRLYKKRMPQSGNTALRK